MRFRPRKPGIPKSDNARFCQKSVPVKSLAMGSRRTANEPVIQTFAVESTNADFAAPTAAAPADGDYSDDWTTMKNDLNAASRHPLSADALVPLTADMHGSWRLVPGDFSFAIDAPFIPVIAEEFVPIARSYPIVFAARDQSPLAVLGLDRTNLFVAAWSQDGAVSRDHSQVSRPNEPFLAAPRSRHYVPAFARRYPFGFLQAPSDRLVLGLHEDCEHLRKASDEGVPLFVDGKPSEIVGRALAFCEAFHAGAGKTMAFVAALEDRGLLVDRQADIVLSDGRKLGLTGFRVVDREKFRNLDGPTIVEWHGKGWLALVHHHLASLDQLRELVRWQSDSNAFVAPENTSDANTGDSPTHELISTEG